MAHYFPPAIMNMFAPRPPLEFKAPIEKRKMPAYTGIAEYVARMKSTEVPIAPVLPTKAEVKAKTKAKKEKIFADKRKRQIAKFRAIDPKKSIEGRTKEAYKTLFVARLSYSVTADDLKSEFSYYGPVKHVVLVKDKLDQSRGYAFVEFEHSADLTEAYKDADGRKINGRRILVDVERGRTVKGWLPRRLGGGLGSTRAEVSHSTPAAAGFAAGGYGGSSGGGGYGYGPPQSYNNSYGAPSTGGYSSRVTPADRPGADRPRPGLGASSSSSFPPSSSYAPPAAHSSRSSGVGYGAPSASSSGRWEKGASLDDGSMKKESDRSDRDRDGKSSSSRHSSSRHSSSRHRSSRSSRRSRSYSRSHSRSRSRDRSASRSRSHSPRRHSSSSRSGRSKSTADVKSDVKVEVGEVETGEVKVASSSSRDDRDGKESSSSRSGKSEKRKRSRSRDRDSRSRSRSRDHKSSRHR